ncbi:MAG TPA: hypothetical protein VFD50_07765, partial [Thermoleophilia bacterium]|nr:hypothetical protein [Thermoleophilia bacterium]
GVDGQCMAVMRTGKRCPNQAEPGSRYCSIHANYVAPQPAAKPLSAKSEAAADAVAADAAPDAGGAEQGGE